MSINLAWHINAASSVYEYNYVSKRQPSLSDFFVEKVKYKHLGSWTYTNPTPRCKGLCA